MTYDDARDVWDTSCIWIANSRYVVIRDRSELELVVPRVSHRVSHQRRIRKQSEIFKDEIARVIRYALAIHLVSGISHSCTIRFRYHRRIIGCDLVRRQRRSDETGFLAQMVTNRLVISVFTFPSHHSFFFFFSYAEIYRTHVSNARTCVCMRAHIEPIREIGFSIRNKRFPKWL